MGVVYLAHQRSSHRLVAVKMLHAGAWARPEQLARFGREVEAIARVRHPNIVDLLDFGEARGLPFFAMEFAAGGSLRNRLAGRPLPVPAARRLVAALAAAAHHAHELGIIHRDLNPANVLLTAHQVPKIADFGLAKLVDDFSLLTCSGQVLGTGGYMAPEQAEGELTKIGAATDVYGLGAILYETLTGRPPFRCRSWAETLDRVRFERPAAPSLFNPGVPPELDAVCLTCLAKDPSRRYASALLLAEVLGGA
jgi:serine/threonine-protein kinase